MPNDNERLGASFSIDVTDLKAGLAQANRMIRESESEFRAAAAGMDDWRTSNEGLTAKIKSLNSITDAQRAKVNALNEQYKKAGYAANDMSAEAVDLRIKINKETEALRKNEAELKQQTQALAELGKESKETGEAIEETSDGFTVMKGAAAELVANGISTLIGALGKVISNFFGLAESTREARTNMAKLETSFESAGLTAEQAGDTFTDLYGVLGDEGRATEAAQHLAKISQDEADLAANTRILTGVMAEWGDSIPTEGLAEGMAATAAMGEVQGVLADALEWQGVNLEEYNAKLATLATEEERAAYIQSTLTDLYGASADAYRETNAEVIAAQEAQAGLNEVVNELGAIVEPIMTTLKTLATDLLGSIKPFVALIGEGLTGALSGADGAAESLAAGLSGLIGTVLQKVTDTLPLVIDMALALIPALLTELLGQLPAILQTLLQMVAQIAQALGGMLPQLLPVIINTVVMLVETLLDNIGLLIDAGIALLIGLADGLVAALPQLIAKIPVIITKLLSALTSNLPKLLRAGVEITLKLAAGIVQAIPQLVAELPKIIKSIITGFAGFDKEMKGIGGDLVRGLWNGIKDMAGWIGEKIKGFGEGVLDGLKDFFGIHSPSKVMADQIGKNLALGIGEGFSDNIAGVNDTIAGAMGVPAPAGHGGGGGAAAGGGGVVVYQTNNYSQAHSRLELYKTKQATAAAVRLALTGA